MSIQHAMLALLSEQPQFGLALQQQFESSTGNVWPLNVGQVYTTLQRLERDGLVVSEEGEAKRAQKNYHLTPQGHTELLRWLQTPSESEPPPRDELIIKVLVATQIAAIDTVDLIQTHRRQLIEMMQRYTRMKVAAAEDDIALALVVDAQIFRLEGLVRWLDSAETRLTQQKTTGGTL